MMTRREIMAALAALPFISALVPQAAATLPFTPSPRRYAAAGETVTCTNGHPICEFAKDAMSGETFSSSYLTNWRQKEPKVGQTPIPRCAVCGAPFYIAGNIFHIGTSWRDPHGLIARYGLPADAA
jgi:hypothetical protein